MMALWVQTGYAYIRATGGADAWTMCMRIWPDEVKEPWNDYDYVCLPIILFISSRQCYDISALLYKLKPEVDPIRACHIVRGESGEWHS